MNETNQKTDTVLSTEDAPSPVDGAGRADLPAVPVAKTPTVQQAPSNDPVESKTDYSAQSNEAPKKEEQETGPQRGSFDSFNRLFFRLSTKEKMLFARHMEMMTRSGLQIPEALEILRKQTRSRSFTRILDSLIADVKNGHYLSVGMERYKNIFGDFIINLIRVGETSGTLSENFKYLAEELDKRSQLQKKVVGALIYPIVILTATFGITGIMVFFIFPRILPVLRSLNVELPLATQIFIALSEFLIAHGLILVASLIVLTIGWLFLLRVKAIRIAWHRFLIRLPLIGPLVTAVNIITIARTMNLMLRGGVRIVEALGIASKSVSNLVYRKQIEDIATSVRQGDPMSKLMIERPKYFPSTFGQMANVGESTGKLDETLAFLADFYEKELDNSTKSFTNILEPVLLLGMGLIVSFVAISIVTPIYKISQTLGR